MELRSAGVEPLGRIAALDGLRAIAVVAVLAYHADLGSVGGGFLGVSAFFTLSGFLITSLLLREWDRTGGVDLRRFWSRRFRRLLPASWATLALVLAMAAAGLWESDQLRSLRGDVPAAIAEVANWHFVVSGDSYAGTVALPSPLQHFWSLAVEQQFYVVLPLLVLGVLGAVSVPGRRAHRHHRVVLAVVLVALVAASAAANGVLARGSLERAYFGTDTRAAEMLLGALLAVLTAKRIRFGSVVARRLSVATGVVALVGLVWLAAVAEVADAWLYPWGLLATAVCTAAVILGAVQGGPLGTALSVAPLVALGRISYGVYLLHWPVFLWLTPERTGWDGPGLLAVRVGITLSVAWMSFRWLEAPIRAGRRLRPTAAFRVVPAAAALVLIAGFAVTRGVPGPPDYLEPRGQRPVVMREPATVAGSVTGEESARPAPQPDHPPSSTRPGAVPGAAGTSAATTSTPVDAAEVSKRNATPVRATRVLLVGDSVAASLEAALGDALVSFGVGFGSAAAPGCGVVTGFPTDEQGRVAEMTRPCDAAVGPRQLESVARARPDLVVVMSSWEMTNRVSDGVWYRFGTPEADEMLVGLLGQTVDRLAAGGAAVVLVQMPEPVDGRVQGVDPVEVTRSRHLNTLLARVADGHPARVTTVAFDRVVCPSDPCPAVVDGTELRGRDGRHFDDPSAARWAANRLTEQILGLDLAAV